MSKFFGVLLVVLVSVVSFSCASDNTKSVVDSQGKVTEISGKSVSQEERDRLFEVLLAISTGSIDVNTYGGPIEFQQFFSDKKDLIRDIGITEPELLEVFKNCLHAMISGGYYRYSQDANSYGLLKMKNFKFLVERVGENVVLEEAVGNHDEITVKSLTRAFDSTRSMILAKL